jgi:hypothetical protein
LDDGKIYRKALYLMVKTIVFLYIYVKPMVSPGKRSTNAGFSLVFLTSFCSCAEDRDDHEAEELGELRG